MVEAGSAIAGEREALAAVKQRMRTALTIRHQKESPPSLPVKVSVTVLQCAIGPLSGPRGLYRLSPIEKRRGASWL